MFYIDEDKIYITRGDKAVINLSITDYTFQVGDTIEFRVYEKRGLDKEPTLIKEIKVTEESENVEISLNPEDTALGEMLNKAVTYWYEIELNDNQTIIGYDENGPKELILYPEGAEKDDINE